MCLIKTTYTIILLVTLFIEILTLEVLPIETTILIKTESAIRNITNEIFLGLELKGIKSNAKLKQHCLIHNFFTKLSLKDEHTLAAIATISQLDKNSINNETQSYIDILNELQQEDSINHEENAITNNINVIKFIEVYLSHNTYRENATNGFSKNNLDEVLDMLQSDIEDSNFTEFSEEARGDSKVLSDYEFWEPELSGRRIFKGDRTKIKYFPFMASIHIFHSFQCGGSIIKSDLVITAASCLQLAYNNRFFRENPSFLSVRVGSNFYQGGGENIPVLEVYFHPGYDPKTLKDNLSVLRLVRKINLSKKGRRAKVKKIAIDRHANKLPGNTPGVTIVGWGARTTSNILDNPWSNRLAYSSLDIYSWRDCRDIYSKEFVSNKNFCAGYISKGSGACNKDAGDPGVVKGFLTGVVSFGTPVCGTPDAPTVFTKIGFYADWIDEIIDMHVPSAYQKTTLPPPPYEQTTKWTAIRTTFKIEPVGGSKQKPIPIHEIDALRILNEDEELKGILDTMLTDEDERLVINDELKQLRQASEAIEPIDEVVIETSSSTPIKKAVTRKVSSEPFVNIKKYTVLDANLVNDKSNEDVEIERDDKSNEDVEIDKNIVSIINNLESASVQNLQDNLSVDDEEEPRKVMHLESDGRTKTTKAESVKGSEVKIDKNIEDNILTLLYLSDDDKDSKKFDKLIGLEDEEDGLSIASADFKDNLASMSINGSRTLYEMLPKDEWYDLITEAIEEVSKNKHSKSLCFISFPT